MKIEKLKNTGGDKIYPVTIPQAVADPADNKTLATKLDEIDSAITATNEGMTQLASDINLQNAVQSDKIRDIENVLSTANLGQSAQLSVSGRKTVSLPKNASNGGMQVKLEGLTAENLVVNGDFRNGLTGWIFSPEITNKVLVGDVLSFTAPAASKYAGVNVSVVTGRKYYIRATFKSTSNQVVFNLAGVTNIAHSGGGGFETKSTIQSWASPTGNYALRVQDLRTSGWDEIQIKGGNSGFICVDLTATFGSGNEPDLATCDKMFSSYFEGRKNFVPTGRVRSVGKNLFPELLELGTINQTTGANTASTTEARTSKIPFSDGIFRFSAPSGYRVLRVFMYDRSGLFLGLQLLATTSAVFTTMVSTRYIRVTFDKSAAALTSTDIDTLKQGIQIEKGPIQTSYTKYVDTSLYLTAPELRSNGTVKDEIRKGANGYELVKRVGVGTLGAELITNVADREFSSDTGFWVKSPQVTIANGVANILSTDGSLQSLAKPLFMVAGKFYKLKIDLVRVATGSLSTDTLGFANRVIASSTGSYSIYDKALTSQLIFKRIGYTDIDIDNISIKEIIPQEGAISDTSTFTELSDGTILYTLATPVITPISYGGILNSAENGTVCHEPVIADAGVYGTNMPILLTDYPIASIEEIIKHENGVDTYLDVSTVVIAGDKLSFTHPSLQSGDLVLFTYAFNKETTNGNITATFYDSNVVKIDTVTGKAYKITDVVTNGVLTRTLTEV